MTNEAAERLLRRFGHEAGMAQELDEALAKAAIEARADEDRLWHLPTKAEGGHPVFCVVCDEVWPCPTRRGSSR